MNKITYIFIAVVGVAPALSGCTKKSNQTYGQPVSGQPSTELEQILSNPADFQDKTVTLEGEIITECPTGCWFDMKQGGAVVHVDLKPSGFAIPQKTGRTVRIEGTVKVEGDAIEIIGTGVEIK